MDSLGSVFLSPIITISVLSDFVVLILLCVGAVSGIKILKNYPANQTSALAYKLHKKSYLISTIAVFLLYAKVISLPFFIYGLDELSLVVPGAMCALGVVEANSYGWWVLGVKVIGVILMLCFVSIDKEDSLQKNHPYFKAKLYLLLMISTLVAIEFVLEILYLSNISTLSKVLCCNIVYKDISTFSYLHVVLFYVLYLILLFGAYRKKLIFTSVLSILFLYIAYENIIYFFSPYIYELPTHHCPFCMLQSDYGYVGYGIFGLLILSTFYALNLHVRYHFKKVLFFYTAFVVLCSYFVVVYLFKNGVLFA